MISPANGKLCSKNYKEWITRQIFLAKNLQNLHHTRSISSKEKTGPSSGRSIGDDIYENNRFFISFIIYSVQSRAHSTTHSRCHVEIYALFVLVLIINLQEFSLHSDLHLKISPFTKSTFHRLLFYKSKPIHHDNLQLTRGLLYTVQLFVCEFSSKV